jgi:hypothetical protein
VSSWPLKHLAASLEALAPLPEPFLGFVDRPEALPADAPPGTWKVLVEDGPLGRGAVMLDTWEGDALASSIIRLAQALPGNYDLDAAGRVHLGTSGRFVRGFGFLLREGEAPLLRFELREKEPGFGVCPVASLIARQKDLDRDRRVGAALADLGGTATRAEVWIPAQGKAWLGAVVGDRRVIDRPGGAWIGERVEQGFEGWSGPDGVQVIRALD